MRIPLILLLALLLTSCGSTAITGEVFIVTSGRETIKLSNSPVYLHKFENVSSTMDRLRTEKPFDVFKDSRPVPIAETTTDSEGRFKISVPRGEYVIEVYESRAVGRRREFYWWLVPVTSDHITLNNSNLINLTLAAF